MTTTTLAGGRLAMGPVVSQTFGIIQRNFFTFWVLSFLLTGLPGFLVALIPGTPGSAGSTTFGNLVSVIGRAVLQPALTYGAVNDLRGTKASISDCFSVGNRHFRTVFGISLLSGLGIGLGLVLLIVPGLMLSAVWAVAVPARVIESNGVFACLERSEELTRGNRWPVFGLTVIPIIAFLVVFIGIAVVGDIWNWGGVFPATSPIKPDNVLLDLIFAPLLEMIMGVGVASIYFELRRLRDGVGIHDIASVFD